MIQYINLPIALALIGIGIWLAWKSSVDYGAAGKASHIADDQHETSAERTLNTHVMSYALTQATTKLTLALMLVGCGGVLIGRMI